MYGRDEVGCMGLDGWMDTANHRIKKKTIFRHESIRVGGRHGGGVESGHAGRHAADERSEDGRRKVGSWW